MSYWIADDIEVHNGLATWYAWVDLDLSAVVGANVAFVLLGANIAQNTRRVGFRTKGSSVHHHHLDSSSHGMSFKRTVLSTKWGLYGVVTNADGFIQYRTDAAVNFTVRVLGHCVLSHPGTVILETPHTHAAAWETFDLSAQQGAAQGLAFMEYEGVVDGYIGLRTPGDTRGAEYITDATQGGSNRGLSAASGGMNLAVVTDSNGYYEHAANTGVACKTNINWLGSEVDNYVHVDSVVYNGPGVNGGYSEIDLSAHVNARACCILKIEWGGIGAQQPIFHPRRKGEVLDFAGGTDYGICHTLYPTYNRTGDLLVECDDTGKFDLYSYYGGLVTTTVKLTLVGYIPVNTVRVDSVTPGYLSMRVTFSTAMLADAELLNPNNYTIDVTNPSDDIDFECLSVQPEDTTYPTYVDLVMTDCKNGGDYTLVVPADTFQTQAGDYIAAGSNSVTFVGVSELPNVLSCYSVSRTSMRVVFSKTMAVNDDLDNPSKYTFTNGLRVLAVQVETPSSVLLTTSEQVQSYMYDLTVG